MAATGWSNDALTDNSGTNTHHQSQICHQRKNTSTGLTRPGPTVDLPVDGSSGDQLVQSWYTISPFEGARWILITASWISNIWRME